MSLQAVSQDQCVKNYQNRGLASVSYPSGQHSNKQEHSHETYQKRYLDDYNLMFIYVMEDTL